MKFGKLFRRHLERTLPQWRSKHLRYKLLKKILKDIPLTRENVPSPWFHERFVGLLFQELEKFNDFYVETEEDLIIGSQVIKEKIDLVKANGIFPSSAEFRQKKMEIHRDLVAIHGEMVLLESYSRLNFAGVVKIMKKYDKRTGSSLTLPFAQLAYSQPFFATEPISQLVRECEENLEILFPSSEAEAVQEMTGGPKPYCDNSLTLLLLGDRYMEIHWGTVGAINTMQNLKRTSSTYNPLSMSYVFGGMMMDNESMGSAVTVEILRPTRTVMKEMI